MTQRVTAKALKVDWGELRSEDITHLSPAQRKALLEPLDAVGEYKNEVLEDIQHIALNFRAGLNRQRRHKSAASERKRAQKAADYAVKLSREMEGLGPDALLYLDRRSVDDDVELYHLIDEWKQLLGRIASYLGEFAAEPYYIKGPSGNRVLRLAVFELAFVYDDNSTERPGYSGAVDFNEDTGPFFRFCWVILHSVDQRTTKVAVRNAIRSVLPQWNKAF